jgi:glycine/D-amino acid oxidase-like deaminating enzyme
MGSLSRLRTVLEPSYSSSVECALATTESPVDRPHLDLRGGRTLWELRNPAPVYTPLDKNLSTDIVIIGAGISGSFLAERLSRLDDSIIVLDRNQPQTASTAASTALLLWATDLRLRELSMRIGFARAAEVYRASIETVAEILALIEDLGIHCQCMPRPSLYLAGSRMGLAELADEQNSLDRAGIRSQLLSPSILEQNFGFRREAALYETDCAEVDPMALSRGLLDTAVKRGVKVFTPVAAIGYDLSARGTTILTDEGHEIGAKRLILASGYEMPSFVPASVHDVVSTWVVATQVGAIPPWPNDALIWEASDPYLYIRRTVEGRVIIGGEDERLTDSEKRDRLISAKSAQLLNKLDGLKEIRRDIRAEFAWAGLFGTTEDGLPLIGQLPSHPNVYASFGYGGNGITFSFLAAKLITDLILGRNDALLEVFSIER